MCKSLHDNCVEFFFYSWKLQTELFVCEVLFFSLSILLRVSGSLLSAVEGMQDCSIVKVKQCDLLSMFYYILYTFNSTD